MTKPLIAVTDSVFPSLDPAIPVYDVRSLTEHVEKNLFLRRIPARMFVVKAFNMPAVGRAFARTTPPPVCATAVSPPPPGADEIGSCQIAVDVPCQVRAPAPSDVEGPNRSTRVCAPASEKFRFISCRS